LLRNDTQQVILWTNIMGMKEITNNELIERYLQGDLSSVDSTAFEKQIEGDSKLKNEVDFQRDLISSLKNARSNDLKMRLASIDVSAGFSSVQKFAVAASTLLVGSMIYFGVSEYNSTPVEEQVVSTDDVEMIEPIIADEIESFNDAVDKVVVEEKAVDNSEVEPNEAPTVAVEIQEEVKVEGTRNENPMIIAPEIPSEDDESFVADDVNEPSGANSPTMKSFIDNIKKNMHAPKKKGQFAYEYDKENLDLYGDFGSKPYYLYELKGTGKLYLKYDLKYFEISETKSRVPLQEIHDVSIIESLNNQR